MLGIGTAFVQSVLDRADSKNISVTLFVLKGARAKSLYERMGFSVTGENSFKYTMRRLPNSG